MHELSLCEHIVEIIAEQAGVHGFERVTRVRLEVGALSHAEPEALRFCFAPAARGTVAEGAVLELLQISGRAYCAACAREVPVTQLYDACPACGGLQLQLTAGQELRIKDLEVD